MGAIQVAFTHSRVSVHVSHSRQLIQRECIAHKMIDGHNLTIRRNLSAVQ